MSAYWPKWLTFPRYHWVRPWPRRGGVVPGSPLFSLPDPCPSELLGERMAREHRIRINAAHGAASVARRRCQDRLLILAAQYHTVGAPTCGACQDGQMRVLRSDMENMAKRWEMQQLGTIVPVELSQAEKDFMTIREDLRGRRTAVNREGDSFPADFGRQVQESREAKIATQGMDEGARMARLEVALLMEIILTSEPHTPLTKQLKELIDKLRGIA